MIVELGSDTFFQPDPIRRRFFKNPKPSSKIRTPELAQDSGSNRIACLAQLVEQILSFNPRVDHSTRDFCMSRNSNWVFDEQVCLFNSIRRTRIRIRSILSNKNPNSFNSFEQKECAQPCSVLGLNARVRVQFNSTVTLLAISCFWSNSINRSSNDDNVTTNAQNSEWNCNFHCIFSCRSLIIKSNMIWNNHVRAWVA